MKTPGNVPDLKSTAPWNHFRHSAHSAPPQVHTQSKRLDCSRRSEALHFSAGNNRGSSRQVSIKSPTFKICIAHIIIQLKGNCRRASLCALCAPPAKVHFARYHKNSRLISSFLFLLIALYNFISDAPSWFTRMC